MVVQAARLDLIGRAAGLSLLLAAAPAAAQPLLPDAPLTTLLKPQPLGQSRSLLPSERPATPGQAGQPGQPGQPGQTTTPCVRSAANTRPGSTAPGGAAPSARPAGSATFGGSGPGEYGRFMPGASPTAAPAAPTPGSYEAPREPGTDRPLYGGTDRPLWGSGERPAGTAPTPAGANRPAARRNATDPAAANTPTPDAASLIGAPPNAAAPNGVAPNGVTPNGAAPGTLAVSGLPRDRPLWADGTQAGPAGTPASTADPGASLALLPCVAPNALPPR